MPMHREYLLRLNSCFGIGIVLPKIIAGTDATAPWSPDLAVGKTTAFIGNSAGIGATPTMSGSSLQDPLCGLDWHCSPFGLPARCHSKTTNS